MVAAEIEIVSGEVMPDKPNLKDLATQLNYEHHLVEDALSTAMAHAIRCGEILSEARTLVGQSGNWRDWLNENFDGSHMVAGYYLRVYEYRDLLADCPNVYHARKRLRGMPAIDGRGGPNGKSYPKEIKEEALVLYNNGMTRKEIAEIIGIDALTIGRWVDPEVLQRHKERNREYQRKLRAERKQKREEAQRRANDREAKRVGGSLAESYSLIHKIETPLALAARAASDPEVKRLLNNAIYHQHKALDAIVEALGRS